MSENLKKDILNCQKEKKEEHTESKETDEKKGIKLSKSEDNSDTYEKIWSFGDPTISFGVFSDLD